MPGFPIYYTITLRTCANSPWTQSHYFQYKIIRKNFIGISLYEISSTTTSNGLDKLFVCNEQLIVGLQL